MSDYHVISAVRGFLLEDKSVKKVVQKVHCVMPPQRTYPLVLVELESILSQELYGGRGSLARVSFQVCVYSKKETLHEAMAIARTIQSAMDGRTLFLEEGQRSVLQIQEMKVLPSDGETPLRVSLKVDALVRGE